MPLKKIKFLVVIYIGDNMKKEIEKYEAEINSLIPSLYID